ncbi:glyoxalase [Sphingobium lactosutens]|uniref:VOC family protein n=1 Tax=Sphingobium lactosutens TaxID=522773 RepID=UPI0015B7B082|nr:VOC family protein [Sphingobium lactosutens]NWK98608.1 glyoxalase [Sphingobium lactosutens]
MAVPLPAAAPLGKMHHVAFRCRDAEQTRWFYSEVLGLKPAAGVILDTVPGLGDDTPYMHIFFELGDGSFVAFFDAPETADPAWFERKDSFDMHIALEAKDEADMLAMQQRIRHFGIKCAGPIDHGFVRSVYMYDPNGIQVEITVRTPDHDAVMAEEAAVLSAHLAQWSDRTYATKIARFGADAMVLRGSAPRKGED